MARTHYWQYLADGNGTPIEGARIYVYLSGTTDHANISLTQTSARTTSSLSEILTDSNGYFHFYVWDKAESGVYGYDPNQRFKLVWVKNGISPGAVDNIEIFDIQNDQFFEIANNLSEVVNPSAARANLQISNEFYKITNNLSEVPDPTAARANLGITAIYLEKANNLSDIPSTASALYNVGADARYLHRGNNLSDLSDAAAARANLGIPTVYLEKANNLSDVTNAALARSNLGVTANCLQVSNNLSDLSNISQAQANLSLGTAAVRNVGTSTNNVVGLEDVLGNPGYPGVDGSQITNLSWSNITGVPTIDSYIITHFNKGTMSLGEIIYRHNFSDVGAVFPEFLPYSTFTCETTATSGSPTLHIYKNGEGIGTVTFWTSGSDPTSGGVWFPDEVTFDFGDVLKIAAPSASADPTLGGITITMRGTRV